MHRAVAAAELLLACIMRRPRVAVCPTASHLTLWWWRLSPCQVEARQNGRLCPQCQQVEDSQAYVCVFVCAHVRTGSYVPTNALVVQLGVRLRTTSTSIYSQWVALSPTYSYNYLSRAAPSR